MPTLDDLLRLLTLRDYNTRVVLLGTMLLGWACGMIGSFLLLRKRSLMGDAISHATLPGIAGAFMLMVAFGGSGKSLPGLLLGALLAGLLGMVSVVAIRGLSRIKEDAALGIVLSVYFGIGMALLGIVQKYDTGSAAGLQAFIYGKTASMLDSDAWLIGITAAAVALLCAMLLKEFTLLCFDQAFAGAQGWPVRRLDLLLMGMVVVVTVIGLQAVGLILIIALLIIPPAAARFWTHRLWRMVIISAAIGAGSSLIGAAASALLPRLPAGALIVCVAAAFFLASMIFGPCGGILVRLLQQTRLHRKVARQHLLRGLYEVWESRGRQGPPEADWHTMLAMRSWKAGRLHRLLRQARRRGHLTMPAPLTYRLTERGLAEARRLVHNHRLWEIYLITHADMAASRVDRDADKLEHVLEPEVVAQLERELARQHPHLATPHSPHPLES